METLVPRTITFHCPACGVDEVQQVPQNAGCIRMTGNEVHSWTCDPCEKKRMARILKQVDEPPKPVEYQATPIRAAA